MAFLYAATRNRLRFANPAEATTNSANMAPIGAKLRQNAFRTICNFRFVDADFFFRNFFSAEFFFSDFFSVFRYFRQILEDLGIFGRQNQLPGGILLQMVKFSGP